MPVALYDEAAELDPPNEIGVSDDVSADVSEAEFRPLLLTVDVDNWPCAASIACIVAGDSAPEPELLDFFEPGWDEPEPDIVNGSVPLPKNPLDCAADDICEPTDLTASHAADAAPKAIIMIKAPNTPPDRGPRFTTDLVSKRRARVKYPAKSGLPVCRTATPHPAIDAASGRIFHRPRERSYRIAPRLCPCYANIVSHVPEGKRTCPSNLRHAL